MWESNPLEPSHWQCDVQPLTLISLMRSVCTELSCINTYMQQNSKFHKWVNCPQCNIQLTKQNLQRHILKCTGQNLTKHCKGCGVLISNFKLFCTRSCSASFNNTQRVVLSRKFTAESLQNICTSNKNRKLTKIAEYLANPNICKTCGCSLSYEQRTKSNCSKNCFKQQMRTNALLKKFGGPIKQRRVITLNNGQTLTVDSSWEEELANNFIKRNITFTKCDKFTLSTGESYTPDFYLPSYNCYVDPKAITSFFQKQNAQLTKIKLFESEYNTKVVLIHEFENLNIDFIIESIT